MPVGNISYTILIIKMEVFDWMPSRQTTPDSIVVVDPDRPRADPRKLSGARSKQSYSPAQTTFPCSMSQHAATLAKKTSKEAVSIT